MNSRLRRMVFINYRSMLPSPIKIAYMGLLYLTANYYFSSRLLLTPLNSIGCQINLVDVVIGVHLHILGTK